MRTVNLALAGILFFAMSSCKKETKENTNPAPTPFANLEKTSGVPGEVIAINHNLAFSTYSGAFYGEPLQLGKAGNALSLVVPDTAAGQYTISLTLDNQNFSLGLEIKEGPTVANPDQYLNDLFDELEDAIEVNNTFKDSLVANGYLNANTVAADAATWATLQSQADAEYAAMTPAQKQTLANYLEANKGLFQMIDELSPNQYGFGKTATTCETLRQNGLQALSNGQSLLAARIAVKFKWCQAQAFVDAKTDNAVSKLKILWENTTHPWATVTLANLIGRKIERLGNEIMGTANDEFVADDMDDWGEFKNTLTWSNGEIKSIFTRVTFRAPLKSDIGTAGILGDFATEFDNFIQAYADHINSLNVPLVWRPEFRTSYRTIDFNRDLSIPKSSISDPDVILVNTQVNGDDWEVIFATDETTDQNFSFDIIYDDGNILISEQFNARVESGNSDFTADEDTVVLGTQIQFTDLSTNGATSWSWDFGDGNTSTLQNPIHTYSEYGLFTVSLTTTGATGQQTVTKPNFIGIASDLQIGDYFQGGIIVNIDTYRLGLEGYIISLDTVGRAPWGCDGVDIPGAEAFSDGNQNTLDILAGCTTPGIAADICANYSVGSYNDWYLPSHSELLYATLNSSNKSIINASLIANGGAPIGPGLSSTEHSSTEAVYVFTNNGSAYFSKSTPLQFRAMRKFDLR